MWSFVAFAAGLEQAKSMVKLAGGLKWQPCDIVLNDGMDSAVSGSPVAKQHDHMMCTS